MVMVMVMEVLKKRKNGITFNNNQSWPIAFESCLRKKNQGSFKKIDYRIILIQKEL